MKIKTKLTIACLFALFLTSCATSANLSIPVDAPGFWYGLWHGLILPIAWIISLFDSEVAIYSVYNNDGWYDFGFVLGAGALTKCSASCKK
jgi:hypothetical protein